MRKANTLNIHFQLLLGFFCIYLSTCSDAEDIYISNINYHTRTEGICKRGAAIDKGSNNVNKLKSLSKGIRWYYNWQTAPRTEIANELSTLNLEFVPMVWGGNFTVEEVLDQIPDEAEFLLGFNEPNFHAQANLTPEEAASLWPKLEEIADSRNLTLVSPALNYCKGACNTEDPVEYLDKFFEACNNCRVDHIAVHWYNCDLSSLKSYIERFKKYNKPIWLTEFACAIPSGDNQRRDEYGQKKYMDQSLNYLENDPDIFRYAWFTEGDGGFVPKSSRLVYGSGKLTSVGEFYLSLGQPQGCILR